MKDITNVSSETLRGALKEIQQEFDEATPMQPMSWARVCQLTRYKDSILEELERRDKSSE